MKEVFSKIADAHPNTPVGDRFRTKSSADIKKDKVVKKYNLDK